MHYHIDMMTHGTVFDKLVSGTGWTGILFSSLSVTNKPCRARTWTAHLTEEDLTIVLPHCSLYIIKVMNYNIYRFTVMKHLFTCHETFIYFVDGKYLNLVGQKTL